MSSHPRPSAVGLPSEPPPDMGEADHPLSHCRQWWQMGLSRWERRTLLSLSWDGSSLLACLLRAAVVTVIIIITVMTTASHTSGGSRFLVPKRVTCAEAGFPVPAHVPRPVPEVS